MATYCRNMLDCVSKSDGHWSFIHPADDDFMEETCDSDSFLNSENSYSHPGRANKPGQWQLFIADDAKSTTSDSSYVQDWSAEFEEELEDHGLISYINYLQNASDDDLGIPPNPKDDQTRLGFYGNGDLVQTMDLDLDFDVDLNEGKAENHEDDTLFWLSFLRG